MFALKVVGIWILLLFVAVANGTVRGALLEPRVSERTAHQISSVTLPLLIVLVAVALVLAPGARSDRTLLEVGALWLMLTVPFEFVFGRTRGLPWERLLADYDLSKGRLWVLVLATTRVRK